VRGVLMAGAPLRSASDPTLPSSTPKVNKPECNSQLASWPGSDSSVSTLRMPASLLTETLFQGFRASGFD
jgi:hypothetical protein